MKRKSVALLFLGFVAMFLGIFGAKESVSATSDITISFDFNIERIENYLPQSFFVGLNNFSQDYSYGEEVTFPSILPFFFNFVYIHKVFLLSVFTKYT